MITVIAAVHGSISVTEEYHNQSHSQTDTWIETQTDRETYKGNGIERRGREEGGGSSA